MKPASIFALEFAVLVGAIALLHFYWAVGGKWARAGTVPTFEGEPTMDPSGGVTALIGVLLLGAAAIVLSRGGYGPLAQDNYLARTGTWCVALAFGARAIGDFRYVGMLKRQKGTLFAHKDTAYYVPICVVVLILGVLVALSAP